MLPIKVLKKPLFNLSAFPNKAAQIISGIGGGFVMGLMGTGGPLYVTYLKSLGLNKDSFRFSLIFVLFLSNCIRVGFGIPTGYFDAQNISIFIYCAPAYFFALAIGYKLPKFISDKHFAWVINALLVLSGVSLLIKNI